MDLAARVHAFVKKVPRGRITTYGDVAWAVGRPGGACGGTHHGLDRTRPGLSHAIGSCAPTAASSLVLLANRLRRGGVAVPYGRILQFPDLRWPGTKGGKD
jgi:hypothetical protein